MNSSDRIDNVNAIDNKMAEIIREMIRHEDCLVNHRITWLSQLQGLMFAAIGFSWDKKDAHLLIYCFCIIGLLIAVSSVAVLTGGQIASYRTIAWWDQYKRKNYSGADIIGLQNYEENKETGKWERSGVDKDFLYIGKLISDKRRKWLVNRLYPWYFLPRLFIFAWISIAIFNFFRIDKQQEVNVNVNYPMKLQTVDANFSKK